MVKTNQDYIIKGGRVINPAKQTDEIKNIGISKGKIIAPEQISDEATVIEASGCWVVPGLIDMHVHLREPGEEYKEDIISGCRAAAAGGFTAVACMPNTKPVNDCATVTRAIMEKASKAKAKVYPVAAISKGSNGASLAEFGELKKAGAVAVSDDGLPVRSSQLMRRAIEYAHDCGLTIISHSEETSLSNGSMNEGEVSTRLGLKGIPTAAEAIMVYRDIALAEYTGCPVHIAHVSSAMSINLIREAKTRGVKVTAETAPHYFSLTEEAVEGYNTNAKMSPPLRTALDRKAIIAALSDGTIDAIATDHAPHSTLEKEVEFDLAANGVIGLETSLPLTLELVRSNTITPGKLVELMSLNPARILGVEGGFIEVGKPADITIINPEIKFDYNENEVVSKSKNSPFINLAMQGRATVTFLNGEISYQLA